MIMLRVFLLGLLAGFTVSAAEQAGRKVLAADYEKKRIAIVDESGAVDWEHPIRDIHDLHLLPNGNVLFQTNWTGLVEMTREKKIVWQYDASSANGNKGRGVEVHAFQRLANGDTMIAESGPARIIEVNAEGRIQHQIALKVNKPNQHRDTRLARKLTNGNYLVAHEGDGAVREYDSKGKVVWEHEVGNSIYSALRMANGNTLIGTGNGHGVIEVSPDHKVVWSVKENELPGIKLAWVTTVESHPDGRVVIGNCHAGPENPQIIEVTRDKKVVWTFKNFTRFGNAMPTSQVIGVRGALR